MARADGFIEIPASAEAVDAGTLVRVTFVLKKREAGFPSRRKPGFLVLYPFSRLLTSSQLTTFHQAAR